MTAVVFWTDVSCPWGTLGVWRWHQACERAGVPVEIDHRIFPLELLNGRCSPKQILDAEMRHLRMAKLRRHAPVVPGDHGRRRGQQLAGEECSDAALTAVTRSSTPTMRQHLTLAATAVAAGVSSRDGGALRRGRRTRRSRMRGGSEKGGAGRLQGLVAPFRWMSQP